MAFYPFLLLYRCLTNRLVCLKLHKDSLYVGSDWCDYLINQILCSVFVLQICFPEIWRGEK